MLKIVLLSEIKIKDTLQPRMEVNESIIDDYTEAMKQGQNFPPLETVWDGENYWLWDGYHRKEAASNVGLESFQVNVVEGTLQDAEWLALSANTKHGFNRTNEDKRRAIELAFKHPNSEGKSNYEISLHIGVSHHTVEKYRPPEANITPKRENWHDANLHDSNYIRHTSDGQMRVYTRSSPTANIIPEARELLFFTDLDQEASERIKLSHFQPERQIKITGMLAKGAASTIDEAIKKLGLGKTASNNNASIDDEGYDGDEWYTPLQFINAAQKVMGSIDLDPATCDEAQNHIQANNFYTKETNGLIQDWIGNIWLNPPYSHPLVEHFIDKLINEYQIGNTKQAVIVVNNSSDTRWFHKLLSKYPACFVKGRIPFWRPHRDFATRQGQVFFYLGNNSKRFKQVFNEFGEVVFKL